MRRRVIPAVLVLLFAVLGVTPASAAARGSRLRISTSSVELGAEGFGIHLPAGAKARPFAPPTVYMYKRGDEKLEMYDPAELWRRSQGLGRWEAEDGNALVMGCATAPKPGAFKRPHVMREEFDSAVTRKERAADWSDDELKSWVADFAGAPVTSGPKDLARPYWFTRVVEYGFEGPMLAYAFCLRKSAYFKVREVWYVAVFELAEGSDKAKSSEIIQRQFIDGVKIEKGSEERSDGPSARFQKKDLRPGGQARTPEFIASRDEVVASIRNMQDWWYVETANYIIVSDMKPAERDLVRRIQTDIEYLRAAFEQYVPQRAAVNAVSVVRVFATGAEYENYVDPSVKWTGGLWVPSRKELVIRPVALGGSGRHVAETLRTIYHESFHQYLFYAFDQVMPSAWYNEGCAEFYQTAQVSKDRLEVRESPRQAELVLKIIESRSLDLKRLLGMTYEEFYCLGTSDEEQRNRNYALAWGLVYYLLKWAPASKDRALGEVLTKYGDELWRTRDGAAATQAAFSGFDMARFEADFIEFWKSSSRRGEADRCRIFKDFAGLDQ